MSYYSIGMIAAAILLIINHDILFPGKDGAHSSLPARKEYRAFLFSVLAYYITDILWGLLDELRAGSLLNADTSLYFIAMAASIFLWSRYIAAYLEDSAAYEHTFRRIALGITVFQAAAVAVNLFVPVLFRFDEGNQYHALVLRYVTLALQIGLFILSSVHAFSVCVREKSGRRKRQRTIGFFGLSMAGILALQLAFPLLPMYSMGFMIGTCLLHAFVIEEEKEETWRIMEETVKREAEQAQALSSARRLAYTDPLTGVRSKLAYTEAAEEKTRQMREGELGNFAVAVFDMDGLKQVNDTLGHKTGDLYIQEASRMICTTFQHSPVFRIGGDEFAAFLERHDFEHRAELIDSLREQMADRDRAIPVTVSIGISEYNPVRDNGVQDIFERADQEMYLLKYMERE